jgi:hypothetical protein
VDAQSHYSESRAEFLASFAEYRPREAVPEVFRSSSGEFELEVSGYESDVSTLGYSRGIVRRSGASGAVIADVKRNFPSFWHAWINHSNGNEYLLCGEDYQCYNVIELGSGRQSLTVPPEIVGGGGFCWTSVVPSPSKNLIAVEGCVWGGPWEVLILDFREPLQSPLPEVLLIDYRNVGSGLVELIGWSSESVVECFVETDAGGETRKRFDVDIASK